MQDSTASNKLGALLKNGDKNLVVTDNTNNDVSTTAHGFCPKAPDDTTKFLRGDGSWAVPPYPTDTSLTPVFDSTVTGSAVTSVTTNGVVTLDGNASGGYDFEFIIVEPASTGIYYRLYYNNDTTDTNYNNIILRNDVVGADSVAANDSYIIRSTVTAASNEIHINGQISISPSGIVTCHAVSTGDYGSVSGAVKIMYERIVQMKLATVTNLTRIDVVGSAASSIGVNSRFRLWKRVA